MTLRASAGTGHRPFELIVVIAPMPRDGVQLAALAEQLYAALAGREGIEVALLDDRAERGRGEIQGCRSDRHPGAWSLAPGAATAWWKCWKRRVCVKA